MNLSETAGLIGIHEVVVIYFTTTRKTAIRYTAFNYQLVRRGIPPKALKRRTAS